MAPVGRVSSSFGDHMDQVYNVPCNLCKWLSFFAGHCGKLPMLTQTLLNVTGEGKTSKEGNG